MSNGVSEMPICPSCFTQYPDGAATCARDGASLAPDATFSHVDRDLTAGEMVGEYRIEGKLGQGGFGAVFRAVHPLIGKPAAVKVLSRQFSSNPQMVSRFIAEARAVNQIGHKNIIDIFSFGQLTDGRQYYVMELLAGTPFDQYLAQHGRLTLAQSLPILRGVARAVDAAHAKGILHRDLKPENVYLVFDEDGGVSPKLLDFGLVKLVSEAGSGSHKTKTGTPMGTPYYMSPEQCRGKDVDGRTDVYAFGAMIFEILTGEVPFNGDSAMDVLVKQMSADPPSVTTRVAGLPAEVDGAFRQMLAKDPGDRPRTLGEALELLARAVNGAGFDAAAPSHPSHVSGETSTSLGTVPTLIGKGSSSADVIRVVVASDANVRARSVGAHTFAGSEAEIFTPRRSRSKVVAIGALTAMVAMALVVALATKPGSAPHEPARGLVDVLPMPSPQPSAGVIAGSAPTTTTSAAVSNTVDVRVDAVPPGAKVFVDGVAVGVAPGPFALKTGVRAKVTVMAKGYKSTEITLTPTEAVLVPVALEKLVSPPPLHRVSNDLEGFDKSPVQPH